MSDRKQAPQQPPSQADTPAAAEPTRPVQPVQKVDSTVDSKTDAKKKGAARPPPQEGRCCMWLENRHRYCHMQRTRGSLYCKPHTPDSARIPCPLDPHHTVLPQDLEKHLKRCPGTKLSRACDLPCFSKGCNAGSDTEDEEPSSPERKRARPATATSAGKEDDEENEDEEEARKRAEAGIAEAEPEAVRALVAKVEAGYAKACEVIAGVEVASVEQLHCEACDRFDTECSPKHAAQHTSILAHMQREGMLRRGAVFLELGAGTARMSQLISLCLAPEEVVEKARPPQHQPKQPAEEENKKAVQPPPQKEQAAPEVKERFVLVDRGRFRHKAERMHSFCNPHHVFERVLIDIRDLDLSRMETFRAAPAMVAYGKHLCGAATDLALRCINSWFGGSSDGKAFCGVAIALCCFHSCDWRSYTNKEWLRSLGFTRSEFTLLRSLCSWNTTNYPMATTAAATSATPAQASAATSAGTHGYTPCEKRRLGMHARHILAAGRVLYMRQHGFQTKVVTYVPESVSPENLLLLAVWQPQSKQQQTTTSK